jgi:hypothetical protein
VQNEIRWRDAPKTHTEYDETSIRDGHFSKMVRTCGRWSVPFVAPGRVLFRNVSLIRSLGNWMGGHFLIISSYYWLLQRCASGADCGADRPSGVDSYKQDI